MWARALAVALALCGSTAPGAAQELGTVVSPILTIDQDRLYATSLFGERAREEIRRRSEALAAENRQIETDLSAEEQELTEQRAALPAEEFRALADAFDEKVQRIRAEQDTKSRALSRFDETEQQRFFSQIGPVLSEIVRERSALMIIERRSVFLAAESIDITAEAIDRINEALGDGSTEE